MSEKPYFPLFVDLSDTSVLIIGAGKIAKRRILALLPFAGNVTVLAPEFDPELEELARQGELTLRRGRYTPGDELDARLVLAATDDRELNAAAARWCRERGIPVNDCSDKSLCGFYFPGVARRGDVVVGVTAGGKDHALARAVREKIQALLDADG